MRQLQTVSSAVVSNRGNRGEYPRCELGRKHSTRSVLGSGRSLGPLSLQLRCRWSRQGRRLVGVCRCRPTKRSSTSLSWRKDEVLGKVVDVFVVVSITVPMVQTVQKLGQGPPLPSNDKVVDILIVTQRQVPKVQTSRRRYRFHSCSTTTRWLVSLLCSSCWFPFESLGTCTSSQGGTGGHCGSDRDRSAFSLQNLCHPCSSRHSSWSLLQLWWSRYTLPVVMYVHAHCHRGRPVLVLVVLFWHAHRFVRFASRPDVLAVGYGINAGADCWKVMNSC